MVQAMNHRPPQMTHDFRVRRIGEVAPLAEGEGRRRRTAVSQRAFYVEVLRLCSINGQGKISAIQCPSAFDESTMGAFYHTWRVQVISDENGWKSCPAAYINL